LVNNFESIWHEFNIPLKDFIKKRISNPQDVEDILQNVFIKIFNNIDNLKDMNHLSSYIYKITRNTIIDFYRSQQQNLYIDCLSEELFIEPQDELILNYEMAQCLKTMIRYLPDKYEQALALTEYKNLTQRELAQYLGLSESGAKSRVQRARVHLKEMLLECCDIVKDHRGNIIDYKVKNNECNYCKKDA
jgi:RNA polymerase sigma-70 factor (ECF subfamily)